MALSPTGRRWVLSRWTTIDPMAAKYGSLSPYSYCAGNPIRFFDSDGMKVKGVFDRTARYDIVDNDSDTDHCGWFRLDGQDNKRYNDKDDDTSRDGYRLHLGGLSFGCITIDKTQDNAQKSWDVVTSILKSTTTTNVPEKRGRQWLNPFSRLTHYGTLIVIGDDKTPFKTRKDE